MRFIAFEGLDGSGKSSLIQNLTQVLTKNGIPFVKTREPGGTELAEVLRELIIRTDHESPVDRCELLLYEASRAQHVEKLIRPSLKQGKWVLTDRFDASSVAFQCGGRGISEAEVRWLNAYAISDVKPDLYVLLDLPVEESERRRNSRTQSTGQKPDRLEQEAADFHTRVRNKYLEMAQREPARWLVLDSTRPVQDLEKRFLNELKSRGWLEV